jgi:hypothetical protein
MKNAVLLFGIWLGIVVFAYSVVYLPAGRVPGVELPGDVEVVSQVHGFSLPIPAAWSLRAGDPADVLVVPVAGLEVFALDVVASTAEAAIASAWEAIDPCSSCERSPILSLVTLDDGRTGAAVTLGPDGEGRTGRAIVLFVGDSARVLFARLAPEAALPSRVAGDLERVLLQFRGLPLVSDGATPDV